MSFIEVPDTYLFNLMNKTKVIKEYFELWSDDDPYYPCHGGVSKCIMSNSSCEDHYDNPNFGQIELQIEDQIILLKPRAFLK